MRSFTMVLFVLILAVVAFETFKPQAKVPGVTLAAQLATSTVTVSQ